MKNRYAGMEMRRLTRSASTGRDTGNCRLQGTAFLRSMLKASGDCIKILDADGRLLFMSDNGRRLMEVPESFVIEGCDWLQLWDSDDHPKARAAFETARAGGIGRFQAAASTASGARTWWDVQITPMPQADGQPATLLSISRDITGIRETETTLRTLNETLETQISERTAELMAAEASLRQAQKMEAIGQLTGGIAHDFNNMLQAITGCLEMLELRLTQGRQAEARHYIDGARATVVRAGDLTHRLLAFATRQVLQPQAVDPNVLVDGIAELIRRAVGNTVVVRLSLTPGIPCMLCDPGQVENVLLNLAINARDAMPDGGSLSIATETVVLGAEQILDQDGAVPGAYVGVIVADTGTGIAPEVMDRVFEPFFTTKPPGKGTGLGLSQLYGFVRQSKGVLRLHSVVGQGTIVRVYLPCSPARQEGTTWAGASHDRVTVA